MRDLQPLDKRAEHDGLLLLLRAHDAMVALHERHMLTPHERAAHGNFLSIISL